MANSTLLLLCLFLFFCFAYASILCLGLILKHIAYVVYCLFWKWNHKFSSSLAIAYLSTIANLLFANPSLSIPSYSSFLPSPIISHCLFCGDSNVLVASWYLSVNLVCTVLSYRWFLHVYLCDLLMVVDCLIGIVCYSYSCTYCTFFDMVLDGSCLVAHIFSIGILIVVLLFSLVCILT